MCFTVEKRQTIYLKSVDNKGNPIEGLENSPVFSIVPNLRQLNKRLFKDYYAQYQKKMF